MKAARNLAAAQAAVLQHAAANAAAGLVACAADCAVVVMVEVLLVVLVFPPLLQCLPGWQKHTATAHGMPWCQHPHAGAHTLSHVR